MCIWYDVTDFLRTWGINFISRKALSATVFSSEVSVNEKVEKMLG